MSTSYDDHVGNFSANALAAFSKITESVFQQNRYLAIRSQSYQHMGNYMNFILSIYWNIPVLSIY